MALADLPALALFVAVYTATPGGATTLATASGAHFGYRRSLPFMAGIAAGLASMSALAALGLGGFLLAFPSLQVVLKLAGTLYLLWLAWKIARGGPPHLRSGAVKPMTFPGALWLLWHNPKGWAMSLGAAASFSALAPEPVHLALILGAAFGLAAVVSLSLWCVAGLLLARALRTDRQWHVLNGLLGCLLALSILPMWFD